MSGSVNQELARWFDLAARRLAESVKAIRIRKKCRSEEAVYCFCATNFAVVP